MEIVFITEFLWYVAELDPDVFRAIKWSAEVEGADVEAGKLGSWAGEDTVNGELDCFEGAGLGATVPGVANLIPADCDACPVGVFLLRAYLTDDAWVRYVHSAVVRDVIVFDGPEGVRAGNSLLCRRGGVVADTLAEAAELIGVGGVPYRFVFWMAAELAVFQGFARFVVEDRQS